MLADLPAINDSFGPPPCSTPCLSCLLVPACACRWRAPPTRPSSEPRPSSSCGEQQTVHARQQPVASRPCRGIAQPSNWWLQDATQCPPTHSALCRSPPPAGARPSRPTAAQQRQRRAGSLGSRWRLGSWGTLLAVLSWMESWRTCYRLPQSCRQPSCELRIMERPLAPLGLGCAGLIALEKMQQVAFPTRCC